MKHSKGPWQILKIPDRDYISGELYQILDSDGAAIATMNVSETFLVQSGSRDTLVANAGVMCNAPELLECLRMLVRHCKAKLTLDAESKDLLKRSLAAIGRADGWGE